MIALTLLPALMTGCGDGGKPVGETGPAAHGETGATPDETAAPGETGETGADTGAGDSGAVQTYEASLSEDKVVTVTVAGDTYTLVTRARSASEAWGWSRELALEPDRLLVVDTWTSTGPEDIGLAISHALLPSETPAAVHLAGTQQTSWSGGASNPSTLMTLAGSQLGTVAADAASWVQFLASTDGASVETGLPGVHLPPGASHTFTLALYPLEGGDYWDFINRARQDFAPELTVPAWEFGPAAQWWDTRGALEPYLERREIGVGAALPFLDYDNGWIAQGLSLEDQREGYLADALEALEKIGEVDPALAVLTELEGVFTQLDLERSAELLALLPPAERSPGYPKPLTADQQALLESWGLLEDMPLDDDGAGAYEYYVRDGADLVALLTYPEAGTAALARFEDQVAFSLDTVGAAGVFVDGGGPVNDFLAGPGADGVSARLDPVTGALVETRRDYRLTLAESFAPVYRAILDAGGFVAANGFGYTPEMTALPTLRFMETGGLFDPGDVQADGAPQRIDDFAAGHLGTPVALGNVPGWYGGADPAEFVMRDVIARLAHGLLYAGYNTEIPEESGSWDALNAMFPITPLTLHPGWIVGAERTVTALSGTYTWTGADEPVPKCFGLDGAAAACEATVGGGPGGWSVALTLDDWDQLAVIDAEPAGAIDESEALAYWTMDGSGAVTALADSAGDRDLTMVLGSPVYSGDDPPEGSAYTAGWDGASAGVYLTSPGFVDLEAWTFEAWYRRADGDSAGCFYGNGHVDDYAGLSRVCVDADGVIQVKLVGDSAGTSGNPYDLLLAEAPDDAAWHHLAVVWDGAAAAAYVDRARSGEPLVAAHYAGRLLTDYAYLTAGFANDTTDSPGAWWAGDLDAIRLTDRALDPEDFLP